MEAGNSGLGGDDIDGGGVHSGSIGGIGAEPDESAGIEILWIVAPVCVAVVVVLLGVLAVVFIRLTMAQLFIQVKLTNEVKSRGFI